MVQGQDYTVNEASLPSQTPILCCEWPQMYVVWENLDGRCRFYELLVLATFPWFLCPISLAGDIRIDSLVPWEKLKINNTFEIPPNTQHNLLLMNIGFWCRLCHWEKSAIESKGFLSKSMYIMDWNQYAIELVTYLLVLVVYFYELIVCMLLERNAFDSIAFFSQCAGSSRLLYDSL